MGFGDFEQSGSGVLIPDHLMPDDPFEATGQYCSPEQAAQDSYEGRWFREELQRIDPRLDLVFVKPGSEAFEYDGRWHIWKRNEQIQDQWFVIQETDGSYCAPDQRHMDRFMQGDASRNPRLFDEYRRETRARSERAEKRKQELHREFSEKLEERLKHVFDTQIAIPGAYKAKLLG